jgi:ABC-type cobalamin/Fe3+-siderophores transport system ATPase subunit
MKNILIEKVDIEGLFGHLNYKGIPLTNTEGTKVSTILAPNGYGKTNIFNLIEGFANKNYRLIGSTNFRIFRIFLSNNQQITIKNDKIDENLTISLDKEKRVILKYSDLESNLPSLISESNIKRVGPSQWLDVQTGRIYATNPTLIKERNYKKIPRWMREIHEKINVILIPTDRLEPYRLKLFQRHIDVEGMSEEPLKWIQEIIRKVITKEIQNYNAEVSRNDYEFYKSLIRKIRKNEERQNNQIKDNQTEIREELSALLHKIIEKEKRLVDLQLVSPFEFDDLPHEINNPIKYLITEEYLDFTFNKLSILDLFANKIELYQKTMTSMLHFKNLKTNLNGEIEIKNNFDKELEYEDILELESTVKIDDLSSGEKHLLFTYSFLIFGVPDNSQVLIDEPEISMHPEWQSKTLKFFRKVAEINKCNISLATHSPFILHEEPLSDIQSEYDKKHQVIDLNELRF